MSWMDGATGTGYQVVLVDSEKETFRPASGNGSTARVWPTYAEAEADIRTWRLVFRDLPHLHLAIQRVDYTLCSTTLWDTKGNRQEES